MKSAIILTAAALGASAMGQQSVLAPRLLHTQTEFDLVVRVPYSEATALFGPEGERVWAGKHWDPKFVYPETPHDEQGAVFTIEHGSVTATWVNTMFDVEARHFQYVYFIPQIMVTTIDVRFAPGDGSTGVHVMYTRTALTPEGNEHVRTFTAMDEAAGREWQKAIDGYIASRGR